MKSKPSWLHGGEPHKVADRADMQIVDMPDPTTACQNFDDAKTRTRRALLDLAEHEEEVRLEAALDDELIAEIAAAYDIEFKDEFERALLCEAIKAERIWKKEAARDSRSKFRNAERDSQPLI